LKIARLIVARSAQALVVIFLVVSTTFVLVRLAPGDPFAAVMDNPQITAEIRAEWGRAYGLDRPVPEQYVRYLGEVARGNLGWSFSMQRPVAEAVRDALPRTLLLTGTALLLSFAFGIGIALLQARRPGGPVDRSLSGASLLAYSIPEFWLALMLMLVFSLELGLLPAGGASNPLLHAQAGPWERAVDTLRHLVLPATTLAIIGAAVVARYQRSALLSVLPSDFIRTARAKGVPERVVLRRHALRNALLPTITLLGLTLPTLLAGSVFVEKVFAWPGMGLLAVNAVATRDYAVVTAVVIVAGTAVALGTLLADLLYVAADPRVRDD
jgi:peptide/nickel transport system permease protein